MRSNSKKVLLIPTVMVLAGTSLYLFRKPIALALGDFLIVQDELQPAAVIHVIAGDDYRTDYAVELYQQGYGDQLFFTGGWCTSHQYYHGQHGRDRAVEQGVPEDLIGIDEAQVTSTYDEALRLKDFIAQSPTPVRSVIVVSDPFHMRRARWTYRHVLGGGIQVLMAPVPFEQTPYQRRWWTDDASERYVKDEYVKTVYYIARYQLSWGPAKEWLASLDTD